MVSTACKCWILLIVYLQMAWAVASVALNFWLGGWLYISIFDDGAFLVTAAYLPFWPIRLIDELDLTLRWIELVSSAWVSAFLVVFANLGLQYKKKNRLMPLIMFNLANLGCSIWKLCRSWEYADTFFHDNLLSLKIGLFIPPIFFIVVLLFVSVGYYGLNTELRRQNESTAYPTNVQMSSPMPLYPPPQPSQYNPSFVY